MHTSLDSDFDTFRSDLQKASQLVTRFYRRLRDAQLTTTRSHVEIAALFDEPLPEESQPVEAILREVEEKIFANSTLYQSPRFFGYINGLRKPGRRSGRAARRRVESTGREMAFRPCCLGSRAASDPLDCRVHRVRA